MKKNHKKEKTFGAHYDVMKLREQILSVQRQSQKLALDFQKRTDKDWSEWQAAWEEISDDAAWYSEELLKIMKPKGLF